MGKLNLTIVLLFLYLFVGCSSSSDSELDMSPFNEIENSGNSTVVPASPLDGIGEVQNLGSNFGFLEGPVFDMTDNSLLFSDIPATTIFRRNDDGTIEPFLEDQPTNGLTFDSEDRLLIATQSGRSLSRLDSSGTVTVLVDSFEGARFNAPNDLTIHTNGDVYFTDPPFGLDEDASEVGCSGVYRFMSDGSLSRFFCNSISTRPNGIAFSPNQDRLYVSFTFSGNILSWPVDTDGNVGEVETFATTAGGGDGMAIDAEGNLFVTANAGVEVFAPDGTRLGVIEVPEQVTNCTFGGRDNNTLFITGVSSLYSVVLQ